MSLSSRPRIAILADFQPSEIDPSFPKPVGHYAVWLSSLFSAFENPDTFDIRWITLSKRVNRTQIIQAKGQIVYVVPRARKTIGLYSLYAYDRIHVKKILHSIKPDLVHAWGTEDCYALCGKDFPGKKLLSIQGILTTCIRQARMSPFERRHRWYEEPAIRAYQNITTESPWAAQQVSTLVPGRTIHHLEYAVEERFQGVSRSPADTPTILFGGTNTAVKNIPTLIKAFSDSRIAHVRLRMAGPKPQDFDFHLTPNITALGHVDRDSMVYEMSRAWGLVHPSLADTGPTVAKEARVMGLPVILSTMCGSKQHVAEGKSGYIIEPNDVESLIQAVLSITESKQKSIDMGKWGQAECRQALCLDTMKLRLTEIYNKLLYGEQQD